MHTTVSISEPIAANYKFNIAKFLEYISFTEEKAIRAMPNEVWIEIMSVLLSAALEYSARSSSLACQFCLVLNLAGHQWNC